MKGRHIDICIIIVYIIIGVLTRTVWHIAPNVEFVTAFTLAASYFVHRSYSLSVPFGIMVISDLILGNSPVFIFTWSAFLAGWGIGRLIKKFKFKKTISGFIKTGILSESAGILSTVFFYLWTNFGVVVVSNLYPKTLEGVIQSLVMGLPFLVPQILGNLIIVPSIFLVTSILYSKKALLLDFIKYKLISNR
jgi:hypothetical protein